MTLRHGKSGGEIFFAVPIFPVDFRKEKAYDNGVHGELGSLWVIAE